MSIPQTNMLAGLGKLAELKQRLFFVVGALIVYRLGSFIPVPGVNPEAMARLMENQLGILDMFNMFSGGALGRFSIFALSITPYITASIIVQMLASVIPSFQALRKEGESGRRKLNQYTRWGTIIFAVIWAFIAATNLQNGQASAGTPIVYVPGVGFIFTTVIALTGGSMFLMWLGEQITERGVGNGVSLLIFAGIVSGLPGAVVNVFSKAQGGELRSITVLLILLVVLLVTAFVVYVERGQRRITVNYARRQGGTRAYMNQSSHLPLKLNMSGVIPAIFASSLIMFPATAGQWFMGKENTVWFTTITSMLAPGEPLHMIVYGGLIIVFAFFYTALVFNSNETAENLKKSGALIPGIRPGKATAEYIDNVLTRLTGAGAVYLLLVCLIPEIMRKAWNVPFYFGGTSLLIVVVVVMDFTAQIQAHLVSHQYESLLKKSNLKGQGRNSLVR